MGAVILLALSGCLATWDATVDWDGDGVSLDQGDCNDLDAGVFPGNEETWYDGVDQDCDGNDGDADGDGYLLAGYEERFPDLAASTPGVLGTGDCWDDPASIPDDFRIVPNQGFEQPVADQVHPGVADTWYDGVDADCDGHDDFDQDGDGYRTAFHPDRSGALGEDCIDGSPLDAPNPAGLPPEEVHPGAKETFYDGTDADCADTEEWGDYDADGDGHPNGELGDWEGVDEDCDDTDPTRYPDPSIPEDWGDCYDDDCDGNAGDQDGDGYVSDAWAAACPNWNDPAFFRHLGAGDCWDDPTTVPADFEALPPFDQPAAEEVHPGAEETWYDALDQDCAGDGDFDQDGDGQATADWPDRTGAVGEDCDDEDPAIRRDDTIPEDCSTPEDDNCSGSTNDEGALGCLTWYGDLDGDGYGGSSSRCLCQAEGEYDNLSIEDCDDGDPAVHPAASEVCNGGVDDDCDGLADDDDPGVLGTSTWYADADGDGYGDPGASVLACVAPAGYVADDQDCDDGDPSVHPGQPERCNGVDDDCDLQVDEEGAVDGAPWYVDADGDGYGDIGDPGTRFCTDPGSGWAPVGGDCDDANPAAHPDADEVCDGGGVDEDCDGLADDADPEGAADAPTWYVDADGDGYGDLLDAGVVACTGPSGRVDVPGDCDDADPAIHPAADELCDPAGVDEDCDGLANDLDPERAADATVYHADADGDGYGDAADPGLAWCEPPVGVVPDATDCDDADPAIHPGALEVCDALDVDEDCDGGADDADPEGAEGRLTVYPDADGDGYGDASDPGTLRCDPLAGEVEDHGDCDDADPSIQPAATELCDAADVDEDCDGLADDLDPEGAFGGAIYYVDADGDGFGDSSDPGTAWCDPPTGVVLDNTDCDDAHADASPLGVEVCDTDDVDQDCDGYADDLDPEGAGGALLWYVDADGDGQGDAGSAGVAWCDPPAGWVDNRYDCDDLHAEAHVGGTEACDPDDLDEDCDGWADDLDPEGAVGRAAWYTDADGDGWGDQGDPGTLLCDPPPGTVDRTGDCDDSEPTAYPGGIEVCDAADVDEDCDGYADDADPEGASGKLDWWPDLDGDGFGDASATPFASCETQAGHVNEGTDCNDLVADAHPGGTEVCDAANVDEDCDGYADDADPGGADGKVLYYVDADGDGYGYDLDPGYPYCDPPMGVVTVTGDCDDGDVTVNPAASEVCDPLDTDEDCDGLADDADPEGASGTTDWWPDLDGDGFGDASAAPTAACDAPAGYLPSATDCDDTDAAVNPGGTEVCDPADVDEDCDGLADDLDPEGAQGRLTYHVDADGDGFGDAADPGMALCDPGPGLVLDATDCDDAHATAFPGGTEACDPADVDEDCDGLADDADPEGATGKLNAWVDADGDGYGSDVAPAETYCDVPTGYATNNGDCNDAEPTAWWGATEVCDPADVDEDCDGWADDLDPEGADGQATWFVDADGDGFGDRLDPGTLACDPGPGEVADATDCDDADPTVPAAEVADERDNDCDDAVDEDFRSPGDLVVSELMVDALGTGATEEENTWFEVYNPASHDLVADGVRVVSDCGGEFVIAPAGLVVPAGGFAVLCHGGPNAVDLLGLCDYVWGYDASGAPVDNGSSLQGATSDPGFCLSVGGGLLDLYVGDILIDTVAYGGTGFPAFVDGSSVVLDGTKLNAVFNDLGGSWCYPDASEVYDGLGNHGSPGSMGLCVGTPP